MDSDFSDWLKPPLFPQPQPEPNSALVRAMMDYGSSIPSPAPAPPEKSLLQKFQDAVTLGKKFLETNKKPTRDALIQRVRQIRFLFFSSFGKEAAIVKDLHLLLKDANTKGISAEQFAHILSDAESFSGFFGKLGASSLSCPISQTSRVPATKIFLLFTVTMNSILDD
jgi:hypothetical protein